ncbi:hypothetical protein ACIBJC_23590 [Streptomyces sp. NPDC050509]
MICARSAPSFVEFEFEVEFEVEVEVKLKFKASVAEGFRHGLEVA